MRKPLYVLIACCFLSVPSITPSQTMWFKYIGNPIMDVGPNAWEGYATAATRVIREGSLYKMWYLGYDGTPGYLHLVVGYATSTDGISWVRYSNSPVLTYGPSSWDGVVASDGYIVPTSTDYRMYYFGQDVGGSRGVRRIGYATSEDGISWTKAGANPLLNQGQPGEWDERALIYPSVLGPDSAGAYKMWFYGFSGATGLPQRIGYATAVDESTWTKYAGNPVLGAGPASSWDDFHTGYPRVIYDEGIYKMWYTGGTSAAPFKGIGYATSPDGIIWTKWPANPVFQVGPTGTWDDDRVHAGDIMSDTTLYRMWYWGFDGLKYRTGYAVSPKGFSLTVSTPDGLINSVVDTILVTVRVDNPANMKFTALLRPRAQFPGISVDTLELFDDGAHGDTLAGDGIFANSWIPDSAMYDMDLTLTLYDTLQFEASRTVATVVTDAESMVSQLPQDFHLAQNFPNPFNPSTTIQFSLIGSQFTVLKIYDMLGRDVSTLVNEKLKPGTYSVTWDATGFPSGVYYYRLQAGIFVETKKLLLLR